MDDWKSGQLKQDPQGTKLNSLYSLGKRVTKTKYHSKNNKFNVLWKRFAVSVKNIFFYSFVFTQRRKIIYKYEMNICVCHFTTILGIHSIMKYMFGEPEDLHDISISE